jgi:hypothetical protein
MERLIVENTFESAVTDESRRAWTRSLTPCLEVYGARWARSYLSRDRKRMICEFEAPDAESIRSAIRNAGLVYERVWVADMYGPDVPGTPDPPPGKTA